MKSPLIDTSKVLPVSLGVLISVVSAVFLSVIFVIAKFKDQDNMIVQHEVRINQHDTRFIGVEAKQDDQKRQMNYLQILMVRVADHLQVDTSNPLDKSDVTENKTPNIYLPF